MGGAAVRSGCLHTNYIRMPRLGSPSVAEYDLPKTFEAEVPDTNQKDEDVLRFIAEEIDSVPELEALLLLRQDRSTRWNAEDLAKRLYIDPGQTRNLLSDLSRKQLIAAPPEQPETYRYAPRSDEQDEFIGRVEAMYRREVVRISNLIHSKPSSAVRDFARAFRFTKEK
jgi:hypothetical protein